MGIMDDLLGPAPVQALVRVLRIAEPAVSWNRTAGVADGLEGLSIRARADAIAAGVLADLADRPGAPGSSARPGASAAGSSVPDADVVRLARGCLDVAGFEGWIVWPVAEAAVEAALADGSTRAFDEALTLMAELTVRMSSEFPIRRLLLADLDRALPVVAGWAASPDENVRRLASEGTRSYLPWAIRVPALVARPEATLGILDELYRDPSETVRRSVANHLNDLSRHAPERVVETAARWLAEPDENTGRVVRHALRTLVKKADPDALALLGFDGASVLVGEVQLSSRTIQLPGLLEIGVTLRNESAERARFAVDYVVHYVKATGARAAKVFKLAVLELEPGESRRLSKTHAFRQMTTRVHYSGIHEVEVQVNGKRSGRTQFAVLV